MSQVEAKHKQALRQIAKNVKEGTCVLFLGAGVHAPPPDDSKYTYPAEHRPPLGAELAEKLAKQYHLTEEYPEESSRDLQRVSLYIETEEGLGRKVLVDALVSHLSNKKKPSPALRMLAALPFRIIVTTNYDRLLESALNKYDKEPVPFVYNPSPNEPTRDMTDDPTEQRPLLFKMHGDFHQRESIVITDEDYITFVQRMSDKETSHPVPQTVRYRMTKWPILFVGYSLRDYNLRLLFRTLRWRLDTSNFPKSYAIERKPDLLTVHVWQDKREMVTFVIQDLWTFVPWLYKEVRGEEFSI
jgi:hypothetical protein